MLYEYWNFFAPCGVENADALLLSKQLSDCTYQELLDAQAEIETRLNELRSCEPRRKRSKRIEYKGWIEQTHDLLDRLRQVRDEIAQRK